MIKKLSKLSIPLFILWPFGAFIISLFKLNSRSSGLVFVAFCTLFGYCFAFNDTTADSYRIAGIFAVFKNSSISAIIDTFILGGSTDLYRYTIYGIVKTFSNNPKILFAVFGFFFGLFCYSSLDLLIKERGRRNDFYFFILIFMFFILNPISNINGVRYWTATWVFFLSVMNFVFYGKKIWLLGVLFAPLIHFSYLFYIVIVLLIYLFHKATYSDQGVSKWIYILFYITFLLSWVLDTNVIKIGFITDSQLFSKSVGSKLDLYNSDRLTEVVQQRSESLFHTISGLFSNLIKIYMFIFLLKVKKLIEQHKMYDRSTSKFFAFILLFLSFSYIASSIPSGARFLMVGYLFAIVLFVRIYKTVRSIELKRYILWAIPVFSFQLFFSGYLSYILIDAVCWYGNVFWIIADGIGFTKVFNF